FYGCEFKEKEMNIADKTILITGASRGIGRALVDEALARGARRVYAGARGDLPHADGRVTRLALDVTNPAQVSQAAAAVPDLDVLVNNAGVAIPDDLSDFGLIERHLDVNFLGLLRVTQAFLPALTRSRGAIVNNLSLASLAALAVVPA